jgi:hypothetical protein
MKLLKKNKQKYETTGYLNYASKVVDLNVTTNGNRFNVAIGKTEIELTKEEAKELERLLTHGLSAFDTSYYNFD